MTLQFYNTLKRKKEAFKPIKPKEVGVYSCGPTPYSYAHIGNFRSFVFVDLLKRYLEFKGYKVNHIMNITDIDDKTIRDSAKEGLGLKEFAEKYAKAFFEDIDKLNIKHATKYPKATEHVNDMIKFVEKLVEKGFAYEKLNSVYFDISKFKNYGKLSKIDLSQMKPGARVDLDEYEKDHPGDFTLLKRSKLDELKRGIYYDTKYGKCRPGWHLECSVMSMKYLGETFDIHTGGVDLIFPHHENEIAQSEAYSGKPFVKYWIHCEHLIVDGKKMSKSLGNFYTLRDLIKKGHKPEAIRYELLSTHYRQQLNFTEEGLKAAANAIERLNTFISKVSIFKKVLSKNKQDPKIKSLIEKAKKDFIKNMDDDLNISEAFAAIFDFVKEINKKMEPDGIDKRDAKDIIDFMKEIDSVLGIINFKEEKIPKEIKELAEEREKARKAKDFSKADKIRNEIKKRGYLIEDSKGGTKIKKI